ncbi:MAG TPA: NAD-dependent epimerase/dehydratase family protein [Bryobacteraceae bacterium]|jgi:nucleoside-diphosphate-sugar epimerase
MPVGAIRTTADLEQELSRPSEADVACMRWLEGDMLILGASGKMGPSLARLCRRSEDAAGGNRRILAVSRHPVPLDGIETIACDLLDRDQIARLPDSPNVLYLAGRKFGSSGAPELTWMMNTVVPAIVAERFSRSAVVVFSTGNVYPFRRIEHGGSVESDAPEPVGEYAQSCLGRERVFEHYARQRGLRCLLFRLNYAVDLRYGVLVDVARAVYAGDPVPVTVPAFNTIWQRDANSYALRSLEHCANPPRILNVTGSETIRVREAAEWFAKRFGRPCRYTGEESGAALLSNASACHALLGRPETAANELMEMVASWIESGGELLNKPTHFEVADGKF